MTALYDSVLTKLSQRDSKIQDFHREITENYSQLYLKYRKLEDENESMKKDQFIYRQNSNDPQILQSLRDSNTDLQKRLTQIYEDHKKVQDSLMLKTEEAQKLAQVNQDLQKEVSNLKELSANLDKNIKVKEKTLGEIADQLKLTQDDRDRLIDLRDKLLTEKTQLVNENNQLIQRMMVDKQSMIEQWNEINSLNELAEKKNREIEEERKKFDEVKKKFFASVQQKGSTGGNIGDSMSFKEDSIDLKVFYTGQKSGSTELTPVRKVKMHENEIYAVADAYQGDIVATCGGDGFIKFYDPNRTTPFLSLKSPSKGQVMTAISFGYDNDLFLSGSADKMVYLWSISTQRVKNTFVGHGDRISSVCFIKDMTRIVSGSYDRAIKIWDAAKGSISKTIMCGSSCNSVTVTSDKTRIISGHYDGSVKIYSTKTGEQIRAFKDLHEASITSVTLDIDGNLVLTSSKDNTCKLIDLRMDRALNYSFRHDDYHNPSENNKVCFANYGQSVAAGGSDGKLFLWNSETGKLQHVLSGGNEGGITSTCYSMISGNLYTADASGNLVVWS